MSVHTRSQKLAQVAYLRVTQRLATGENGKKCLDEKYEAVAKKFPTLIHTCGLAQAVAFAEAKGKSKDEQKDKKPERRYLEDLAAVLSACGHGDIDTVDKLTKKTREDHLSVYLRLSRDAINAASWLKRYVEAAGEGD